MSPIDTVPPEILGEIFALLALPPTDCPEDVTSIDADAPPLTLSHVSSRWRQIALSHHALWAAFKVLIKTTTTSALVPIVALWLERAADQLLSFTVWMDPFVYMNQDATEAAEGVLRLLGNRIAKWRRVTLVLPGSRVPSFSAALCSHFASNTAALRISNGEAITAPEDISPDQLPVNLEHASFSLGNWVAPVSGMDTEPTDVTSFLRQAPKLRSFAWSARASWGSWDAPHYSGVEKLRMHWHQLTDVRLDAWITLRIALEILEQCPAIVRFELNHFVSGDASEEADVTTLDTGATPTFAPPHGVVLGPGPNTESTSHTQTTGTWTTTTDVLKKYSPAHPLHLAHLETLSIYQLHLSPSLGGLFARLACPALSSFAFSCGFVADQQWPQAAFHDMLTVRSDGAALRSLFLEYSGITEAQLVQCLEDSSERLESLELYDGRGYVCVTDTLLQRLHAPPPPAVVDLDASVDERRGVCPEEASSSVWREEHAARKVVLCPKLKRLVMHYVVECEDGALTNMLLSRLPPMTVQTHSQSQSPVKRGRLNADAINRVGAEHSRDDGDAHNDHKDYGTHNAKAKLTDRCARLEFVDAMFSKTYLARNSVDTAFLRTLPRV